VFKYYCRIINQHVPNYLHNISELTPHLEQITLSKKIICSSRSPAWRLSSLYIQSVSKWTLQWYSKCYFVASVTKTFTFKGTQTTHCSKCWMMDNLYTFKFKCFRNTRHKVTFGIPLWSSFWNTPHYQWKSHSTVTIPDKTLSVLLHYDCSKHCTRPMNTFT
jgi:hypothetical protein